MVNVPFLGLVASLEKSLDDCDTILDVGCGSNTPLQFIKQSKKYTVGIDGYSPSIEASQKRHLHNEYRVLDVKQLGETFGPKSFEAVVALDIIEHLNKKDGIKLLQAMEVIAARRVVIVTPNGFVPQNGRDNILQQHLSGWSTEYLTGRGYKVQGLYGWKMLRREEASLRFRPKLVWGLVSQITHYLYTRHHPQAAYSLLAWKDSNN